jgi:lipoate-protein ligase A
VPLFPKLNVYHDKVPRSAAMNMALDEALWQSCAIPTLRLYEWDHPAITFGYFGRYTDVIRTGPNQDVVRRCTGGGIVFHGTDLTYALIVPPNDGVSATSPRTAYAEVHRAIQWALRDIGIEATLVESTAQDTGHRTNPPPASPTSTGPCFANPVAFDLLVSGKKVAGAAQRRSRAGLLQQGSIQNVQLSQTFPDRFAAALCESPENNQIDQTLSKRAQRIADEKYATESWLRRC